MTIKSQKSVELNEQLALIQTIYPQAHICSSVNRLGGKSHLLIIPGVMLPDHWNKTICTILTEIPPGFPASPPNDFYVDLPDLALVDGNDPEGSNNHNDIPGFPEWTGGVRWFSWHLQAWNPNSDTLYTWMKVIMQRLKIPQ